MGQWPHAAILLSLACHKPSAVRWSEAELGRCRQEHALLVPTEGREHRGGTDGCLHLTQLCLTATT